MENHFCSIVPNFLVSKCTGLCYMQIATHECTNDTQATFPPLRLRLVVICITSSMPVYVCLCVFICVYSCMHIVGSQGCRSVLPAKSDHALSRLITISTIATPVIRHGTVPCYIQIACVITSCSNCSHLLSHSTSLTISSHYCT